MRMAILLGAALSLAAILGVVAQRKAHPPSENQAATAESLGAHDELAPAESDELSGDVREVIDVAQYTYLRLGAPQGEVWAAVSKAPIDVGSRVSITDANRMERFESATLKRTFDVIYFGNLAGSSSEALPPGHPPVPGAGTGVPAGHAHGTGSPSSASADLPAEKVARAGGKNAKVIEELFAGAPKLSGKTVRVRGQVTKVTPAVQGKNYFRLRDGSETTPERRELVVTSEVAPERGAVVTVEGTLQTDVDVGIGFRYPVLLADAKLVGEP